MRRTWYTVGAFLALVSFLALPFLGVPAMVVGWVGSVCSCGGCQEKGGGGRRGQVTQVTQQSKGDGPNSALRPCPPRAGQLHRTAAKWLARPAARSLGRSLLPRSSAPHRTAPIPRAGLPSARPHKKKQRRARPSTPTTSAPGSCLAPAAACQKVPPPMGQQQPRSADTRRPPKGGGQAGGDLRRLLEGTRSRQHQPLPCASKRGWGWSAWRVSGWGHLGVWVGVSVAGRCAMTPARPPQPWAGERGHRPLAAAAGRSLHKWQPTPRVADRAHQQAATARPSPDRGGGGRRGRWTRCAMCDRRGGEGGKRPVRSSDLRNKEKGRRGARASDEVEGLSNNQPARTLQKAAPATIDRVHPPTKSGRRGRSIDRPAP